MIIVNKEQCGKVAQAIRAVDVRPEYHNREFIGFETDRETKLRIYFLSVAICHQTHQLHHPDLNLWGWDYIEYAFLQMLRKKHPLINPGYVSTCDESEIIKYLQEAFSPDGDRAHCTLDRIEERAGMILEICRVVRTKYNRNITELIDGCEGKLLNNGNGLYEVLAQFTAFSDPLKKKITFFLKLASDAGLIWIKDPENLVPIMDYHMQRVLLRTGCVEIVDDDLRKKIASRNSLPSDEPIRTGCIEAIKLISQFSDHATSKLNDFFWPLGRSCCNESQLCQIRTCGKNPCSLIKMLTLASHDECLLEDSCKGATNADYRRLWEPEVKTHYY